MEEREKTLSTIGTWSNFVGWLLAAVYLAIAFTRFWEIVRSPIKFDYTLYANTLNLLNPLLLGAFYFLLMQAVSHAIDFFLEWRDLQAGVDVEDDDESAIESAE